MANRRRNLRSRSKPTRSRPRKEVTEAAKSRSRSRLQHERKDLDEEWETLNAKIGVLENFITGSIVHEEKKRRLRSQNILPPPESPHGKRKVRNAHRMSRWEAQNYYGKRERNGLTFLLWFGAVCAVLWWLVQTGAFLS